MAIEEVSSGFNCSVDCEGFIVIFEVDIKAVDAWEISNDIEDALSFLMVFSKFVVEELI